MADRNRRRLLQVLGALGLTAGCSALSGDGDDPSTSSPTTDSSPTETGSPTETAPPTGTSSTTARTATTEPSPDATEQPTTTTSALPDDPTPPADMAEYRAALSATSTLAADRVDAGPFDADWESLEGYTVPEWFRDRKFGVYFHWGLYSVPGYRYEWYPKWMYTPDRDGWGSSVYDHHVEWYGPPDSYPYQRFAEEFTAEEFDPERWADIFAEAGAGFAGPVAEHHDGWSNWASGSNPYSAAAQGPERDLVGDLETAIRDRDMKFVTTFHHGRAARPDRKLPDDENYLDSYFGGAYENFPDVTEGFPNRIMYRNVDDGERWDTWLGKLVEVCERYEPDLVWHDSLHVPPDDVKLQYLAYNLNRAAAQERDVAITYKEVDVTETVRSDTLTLDFENDQADSIREQPWLSDINVANGAWCYTDSQEFRPVGELVAILAAIVSKNGQMLLNVPPKPDGTLPDPAIDRLRGIGDWLDVNGEAIYGTRPWRTWNDGDTVRYTQSKDGSTLYAIAYGYPEGDLTLSEAPSDPGSGATVRMLGYGDVDYDADGGDLVVTVPSVSSGERPSDHAVSFALEGFVG